MLGQSENSAPYIYIQKDPFKPEAIRLAFDSEGQFNAWLEAIQLGRKTPQQIAELQREREQNHEPRLSEVAKQGQIQSKEQSGPVESENAQASPVKAITKERKQRTKTANTVNIFGSAIMITAQDEVKSMIKSMVTEKFDNCSWTLKQNYDGINIYTDKPDINMGFNSDNISVALAVKMNREVWQQ